MGQSSQRNSRESESVKVQEVNWQGGTAGSLGQQESIKRGEFEGSGLCHSGDGLSCNTKNLKVTEGYNSLTSLLERVFEQQCMREGGESNQRETI